MTRSPVLAQEPLALRSVQADFSQEKHLRILVKPIISQGVFLFQTPDSLRWEYLTPLHSLVLMHKGHTQKFTMQNNRLEPDQSMGMDAMPIIFQEISNWLKGRFTDNAIFQVEKSDAHTVILRPREEGMQKIIQRIELHLGDQQGLVERVVIVESEDAYTLLLFHNVVLNPAIAESRFTQP